MNLEPETISFVYDIVFLCIYMYCNIPFKVGM